MVYPPDPPQKRANVYETPTKVGAVKIVSVEGMKFTLVTAEENVPPTTFIFNLATRQFENPNGTPIPTTPLEYNEKKG